MQEWLITTGITAGIIGGIVHLFPNILTKMVNKSFVRIPVVGEVTLQRIVGAVSATILVAILWLT